MGLEQGLAGPRRFEGMYNPVEGMKAPGISLQDNRHRQDWGQLFGSGPGPRTQPKEALVTFLLSP